MNAPGADDDASGIATLTEVLRIAMAEGYRPRRTVMFMGYSAEEVGLRGSRAIAQRFAAEGRNVVGVLQMDMTNYRAPGSTATSGHVDNSHPQLCSSEALFDAYLLPLGYTLADSTCGMPAPTCLGTQALPARCKRGPVLPRFIRQRHLANLGERPHATSSPPGLRHGELAGNEARWRRRPGPGRQSASDAAHPAPTPRPWAARAVPELPSSGSGTFCARERSRCARSWHLDAAQRLHGTPAVRR